MSRTPANANRSALWEICVLRWRLGRFRPGCARRLPATASAGRRSSPRGPAGPCTAPSAGAKHPAPTPACPGHRRPQTPSQRTPTGANRQTGNITERKDKRPCHPLRSVFWPRAPAVSCLVRTVGSVSPEEEKNMKTGLASKLTRLSAPTRSAERAEDA